MAIPSDLHLDLKGAKLTVEAPLLYAIFGSGIDV